MSKPYRLGADHLLLAIRLTPNRGRDVLEGADISADGQVYLKARVTAVPEKGKANKALIALVAKALRCPKSSIAVISGDTSRQKILRIDGNPEDLAEKVDSVLAR
ncbi:DUF167 domain-containing protein [Rhizobium sp. SL42]|uniref:DUF167 domain-containing protein n=1 Tax=Rhizobium sp. SL42 TaxID=2806346 RepID=UPI001F4844BE|nr:DUF167 domain-containing protein [Rhizobium sp. SL42]UJW75244.1 DUF167 domain-containing protein [Rhizobium sp. SL42]